MHKVSYALFALPLMLLASMAHAQTAGTISFSANQTTATGSLTPVLTWSTTPVATSCTASGGWSGTKFASGTETLASITSSQSYTLTCTWGGGTATISWTAPTANTDGSSLTDLSGFKVAYGTSSTSLGTVQAVNDAKATSATVAALASGTWYFAVRAVTSGGVESANSPVVQKTIASASAAKTVAITINAATPPPPPPPATTLKTTNTRVYQVVFVNGVRSRGTQVGTIAIGKPCDPTYQLVSGSSYFAVNKADVKFTQTATSQHVIARCAKS